ncbi:MAG TPA: AAA family ATPase [Thermococcus sp.]|nr:AAA family ATPase [Thermococcus sp.]
MSEKEYRIYPPAEIPVSEHDVKGTEYKEILERVARIIYHQKNLGIKEGIKGFIFYGEVGIGKTFVAKAIASKLGSYLIFVDGADIARAYYGQSERQIANLFREAEKRPHTIVLIDDCESVFPKRDWIKGQSWHVAQNNVFFHCLDNLDTSKVVVILTTNRFDLIDKAIIDRLYPIEFPLPSKQTLKEIARHKCLKLRMTADEITRAIEAYPDNFKTVRDVEKYIIEYYIRHVEKIPSDRKEF